MSIGSSGRIVIEVEPNMKRELYAQLAADGLSLKQWFLRNALIYVEGGRQMPLALAGTQGAGDSDVRPVRGRRTLRTGD